MKFNFKEKIIKNDEGFDLIKVTNNEDSFTVTILNEKIINFESLNFLVDRFLKNQIYNVKFDLVNISHINNDLMEFFYESKKDFEKHHGKMELLNLNNTVIEIELEKFYITIKDDNFIYIKTKTLIDVIIYKINFIKTLFEFLIDFNFLNIYFDFTHVDYIDSSAISTLYGYKKRFESIGGEFRIINSSESINNLLKMTNLDDILKY